MGPDERVLELVREAVPNRTVFDNKLPPVDLRPPQFLVVYLSSGTREAGNIGEVADRQELTWQVTSIATSDDPRQVADLSWQARWASQRVRDYLVARRLTPSGSYIRHTLSTTQGDNDQLVTTQAAAVVDHYEARA